MKYPKVVRRRNYFCEERKTWRAKLTLTCGHTVDRKVPKSARRRQAVCNWCNG